MVFPGFGDIRPLFVSSNRFINGCVYDDAPTSSHPSSLCWVLFCNSTVRICASNLLSIFESSYPISTCAPRQTDLRFSLSLAIAGRLIQGGEYSSISLSSSSSSLTRFQTASTISASLVNTSGFSPTSSLPGGFTRSSKLGSGPKI